MDFSLTPEEQAFRRELRSWLEANLPPGWVEGKRQMPTDPKGEEQFLRDWQRKLYEGGWAGLSWPKEYGGRGATLMEQVIYEEETARVQAPPMLNMIGIGLVGPTLMVVGTEEQKKRYIPKILSAEEVWCQGFSEPNAGSDLASLRTKAVQDGDHWVINGQKIWTSYAHLADRCFLLARTDDTGDKHYGITAFIVDMHQPGVEPRPIHQMNDHRDFNETFFTNAVVPNDQVVGQVNEGWKVAITLLSFERASVAGSAFTLQKQLDQLVDYCRTETRCGVPLIKDPLVRSRLADYHSRGQAARLNVYRHITQQLLTGRPGPEGSMDKYYCSELQKELLGFAASLVGPGTAIWPDWHTDSWQQEYLSSFGMTIAGGTSEIQKNIVAERILGLPKDAKA